MIDNYKNTISEELIAIIFSSRSTSIRKKILWEFIQKRKGISKQVYNQNIYRLNKKGFIYSKGEDYILSEKGVFYYKNPYKYIREKINKKNKIILIFDIPENKRKVRWWIRNQIKFWDFKMIQKSVWVGYGPLPSEFMNRLKLLEVDKCVKIFNTVSKIN